eukprot:3800073-Amphidinium_carterae.1
MGVKKALNNEVEQLVHGSFVSLLCVTPKKTVQTTTLSRSVKASFCPGCSNGTSDMTKGQQHEARVIPNYSSAAVMMS